MTITTDINLSLLIEPNSHLVSYKILIDGEEISAAYHILSISIEESLNKIPSAILNIKDGSASEQEWKISNDSVFRPGKKIEIFFGHNGNNEPIFKGIIIINTHKVNDAASEITIECKDEREKMTATQNGQYFSDKTDIEVAQKLLDDNKLSEAELQEEEGKQEGESKEIIHERLVQSNVSDWDFMISRLDVSGQFCHIHNGIMKIKKPNLLEKASLELTYGANILEFHADMDSRLQSSEVQVLTWNFKEQRVDTISSENPAGLDEGTASGENSGDEKKEKKDNASAKSVLDEMTSVINKPHQMRMFYATTEEQQAITNSKRTRKILTPFTGRVKYNGSAKALPGNFIKLNGLGDRFNLKSFISAIKHDYADGCWTTEATLGWDEKFFAEIIHPEHPASGTGQISTVQGLHIGIVQKIIDPTGEYRVKVKLPLISESDEGVYARIATLDAGHGRGTFFRPEEGDEVLVGFMNNDPRHPVILGMLHSNKKQSPLEPEEKNSEKGFVSRSGIRIIFNDEKKSVIIKTPGERIFEMDDEGATITITDTTENKILMDKNGITIEAVDDLIVRAGKSISLEAPEISLKADSTMSIEGGGKTSVKSAGNTEIKGSTVMIN